MDDAIRIEGMSKKFGKTWAVDNLYLSVPEGSFFALLGSNGAGKTTTIKTFMNILRPTHGKASVLGVDSQSLSPKELRQIGYVSENQKLPEWMSVGELLNYCKPMYPSWDDAFCAKLFKQFDLPLDAKLRSLSRGMKVKASLLSSLSYRPRLLVLDEPFTGLDPLVRDELIQGMLELTESERWTIFISSHDINEVERLVDHVGFIDKGRLKLNESLDSLLGRFRKVEVSCESDIAVLPELPAHWLLPESQGRMLAFFDSKYAGGESEALVEKLFPGATINTTALSLREVFVTISKSYKSEDNA